MQCIECEKLTLWQLRMMRQVIRSSTSILLSFLPLVFKSTFFACSFYIALKDRRTYFSQYMLDHSFPTRALCVRQLMLTSHVQNDARLNWVDERGFIEGTIALLAWPSLDLRAFFFTHFFTRQILTQPL